MLSLQQQQLLQQQQDGLPGLRLGGGSNYPGSQRSSTSGVLHQDDIEGEEGGAGGRAAAAPRRGLPRVEARGNAGAAACCRRIPYPTHPPAFLTRFAHRSAEEAAPGCIMRPQRRQLQPLLSNGEWASAQPPCLPASEHPCQLAATGLREGVWGRRHVEGILERGGAEAGPRCKCHCCRRRRRRRPCGMGLAGVCSRGHTRQGPACRTAPGGARRAAPPHCATSPRRRGHLLVLQGAAAQDQRARGAGGPPEGGGPAGRRHRGEGAAHAACAWPRPRPAPAPPPPFRMTRCQLPSLSAHQGPTRPPTCRPRWRSPWPPGRWSSAPRQPPRRRRLAASRAAGPGAARAAPAPPRPARRGQRWRRAAQGGGWRGRCPPWRAACRPAPRAVPPPRS
jgi:hypothetical protein